jgi:hypothetical protein
VTRRALESAVALLLFAAAVAPEAGARRLELRFVPDGEGPVLFVQFEDEGGASGRGRAASWVLFAKGQASTGSARDEAPGTGRAPFREHPAPPAGVGLETAPDGALLLTLAGLGDWQGEAEGLAPRPLGTPLVASRDAARLFVDASPGPLGEGALSPAILYGTQGATPGKVSMSTQAGPPGATSALLNLAGGLVALDPARPPPGGRVFVAALLRGCERATPSGLVVELEGAGVARLFATAAAPACLPDGRVVLPLAGTELHQRDEAPVRGLVVLEPGGEQGDARWSAPPSGPSRNR